MSKVEDEPPDKEEMIKAVLETAAETIPAKARERLVAELEEIRRRRRLWILPREGNWWGSLRRRISRIVGR